MKALGISDEFVAKDTDNVWRGQRHSNGLVSRFRRGLPSAGVSFLDSALESAATREDL